MYQLANFTMDATVYMATEMQHMKACSRILGSAQKDVTFEIKRHNDIYGVPITKLIAHDHKSGRTRMVTDNSDYFARMRKNDFNK